jgi:hypothetical protein
VAHCGADPEAQVYGQRNFQFRRMRRLGNCRTIPGREELGNRSTLVELDIRREWQGTIDNKRYLRRRCEESGCSYSRRRVDIDGEATRPCPVEMHIF